MIEPMEHVLAVKRAVKELGDSLTGSQHEEAKAVFNERIGRSYFGTVDSVVWAHMIYEDHEYILPFYYSSCYCALQLATAAADIAVEDEVVMGRVSEVERTCAELIQAFEAETKRIYDAARSG